MRERGTILQAMRDNRHAYDKDLEMQDRLHAAIEALGDDVSGHYQAPLPSDAGARDARLGEIKAMMADRHSNYWRSENIQSEYRQLLGGGGEDSGGAQFDGSAPAAASPTASEGVAP